MDLYQWNPNKTSQTYIKDVRIFVYQKVYIPSFNSGFSNNWINNIVNTQIQFFLKISDIYTYKSEKSESYLVLLFLLFIVIDQSK